MIESKRFALLAIIVIAFLLTIGNWATPAQATNTGIIATTPTPTGTPVSESESLDVKVSALQEKEMRSIIQA